MPDLVLDMAVNKTFVSFQIADTDAKQEREISVIIGAMNEIRG